MKLNIGSGSTRIPGFLNVDSNPVDNPDYCIDITKGLPFPDNSVDEVIAFHILEHIGNEFFFFLQELYRVCSDNAIIHVKVPHHRHDVFVGDPTHVRPITIEMMRRFSQSYYNNFFTESTNFAKLHGVDFDIVGYEYIFEPYFTEQFKMLPTEQVDLMARIYNNVIIEIHFDMRVIKHG